jgi:hypothetical protein
VLVLAIGKGIYDYYDVLGYITNGACFLRDGASWPSAIGYVELEKGITSSDYIGGLYPNHLFSIIIGLFFKLTGKVSVLHLTYLSSFIAAVGNIFLGFAIKRFFPSRHAVLVLVLILINSQIWHTTSRPITDPWAWTIIMVIFWGMVTNRFNGFGVGVLIGVAGLFRGQMLQFVPILPLLKQNRIGAGGFFKEFLKILIGTLITVFVFQICFSAFIKTQDNSVQYYVNDIMRSFKKTEFISMITWFLHWSSKFLYSHFPCAFLFTIMFLFCQTRCERDTVMKKMAVFAIIAVLPPLICYSIIAGVGCDARYYIYAIPMFYIVAYEFCTKPTNKKTRNILVSIFAGYSIVSGALFMRKGALDLSSFTKEAIYREKLDVTDLSETDKFIRNNFSNNSVLMINNWFISAYHSGRNLVWIPSVEVFKRGINNCMVDGIVLIIQEECREKIKNWLDLDSITDDKGNTFVCVLRENKRWMISAVFVKK